MQSTKIRKAMMVVVIFILCAPVLCRDPAVAGIFTDIYKKGVVKVIAHIPGTGPETGAGMVVGLDGNIALILTALHVCTYEEKKPDSQLVTRQAAPKIEVVFATKRYEKLPGRVFEEWYDDLDMALIIVDLGTGKKIQSALPTFTLGAASSLKGDNKVYAIGHPQGYQAWSISIANTVISQYYEGDSRKFKMTQAGIGGGNSGGPVFDDRGYLVGMVLKTKTDYIVAVKMESVIPILRDRWMINTNKVASQCTPSNYYPNDNITFIVPWGAGGRSDLMARMLSAQLSRVLRKSVNVINRTGGSRGSAGWNHAARAKANGNTLTIYMKELPIESSEGPSLKNFETIALFAKDSTENYYGLLAPKNTPRSVICELEDAARETLRELKFREFLRKYKTEPYFVDSHNFIKVIKK